MKRIIVTVMLLFAFGAGAATIEETLYRKALKATFTAGKSVHTRALGSRNTLAAEEYLLKLLDETSSWDRAAAVYGLALIKTRRSAEALVEKLVTDHMIDDDIKKVMAKRMKWFLPFLKKRYVSGDLKKSKKILILTAAAESKTAESEKLLKEVIENEEDNARTGAFKLLTKNFPRGNYTYIRGYVDHKLFRGYALSFIVEKGSKRELKFFIKLLQSEKTPAYRIIAFKGIQKWGSQGLKRATYLKSLKNENESIARGGMQVFKKTTANQVMFQLIRLVQKGEYQATRIQAALNLLMYRDRKIVPSLIVVLDERYSPRERRGIDIAMTAVSFGLVSILSDISEKSRKSSFKSDRSKIIAHLQSLTGVNAGYSYQQWYQWAVFHGYTVRGANIIQFLFSGYNDVRKKAVGHAILLLGYKSHRDFFHKHGTFKDDHRLSLFLADLLVKKGFMMDEQY